MARAGSLDCQGNAQVFRSRPLNLKLVDDRIEALSGRVALLLHLKTEGREDPFMVKVLKRVWVKQDMYSQF